MKNTKVCDVVEERPPLVWEDQRPNSPGWYRAKHFFHGIVVVHLIVADAKDGRGPVWYVGDQGFGGWNELKNQFTHWIHEPLFVPTE